MTPIINAVYPFGKHLLGLATDRGLLTYFLKSSKVVKTDFPYKHFIGLNMFNQKSLLLLEEDGTVTRKDLRELFIQINKDTLSKASADYTEKLLTRNYKNLIPQIKENITASRFIIFNNKYYRMWLFGATPDGLLSQAGPWGTRKMVRPPALLPGAFVRDLVSGKDFMYIAADNGIFLYNGREFRFLYPPDKEFLRFYSDQDIYYAAGRKIYKLAGPGRRSQFLISDGTIHAFAIRGTKAFVSSSNGSLTEYHNGRPIRRVSSPAIEHLIIGRNNLYAGTRSGGVLIYSLSGGLTLPVRIDRQNGLPDNSVSGLILRSGRLWIGTSRGGWSTYDIKNGTVMRQVPGRNLMSKPVSGFSTFLGGKGLLFHQGNSLVIGGQEIGQVLRISFKKNWPLYLQKAVVFKNDLVVGGAGGVFIYPSFTNALKPFAKLLGIR